MKATIFAGIMMLFSTVSFANGMYLSLYGMTDAENPSNQYLGNDGGFALGVEGDHIAMEVFSGTTNNSRRGWNIQLGTTVGSFKYSLGIGTIEEQAHLTDTTGNWDSTVSPAVGKSVIMGLIQAEHSSGVFVRYSRHTYEEDYTFKETATIGGVPQVVDSKYVNFREDRDLYTVGYKVKF